MGTRDRTTNRWMVILTGLWVLFAAGLVVFILFSTGVLGSGGGGNDSATQTTTQQDQAAEDDSSANGDNDGQADEGDANGDEATAETGAEGDTESDMAGSEEAILSEEQAERGQQAFAQHCASCHGGQLDGEPPLTGDAFLATWEGQQVRALYEVISQTMPLDAPGSLDQEVYEDVTAHVLHFNGMPTGDQELDANDDDMMQTTIQADGGGDANGGGDQDAGQETVSEDGADDEAANGEAAGDAAADGQGIRPETDAPPAGAQPEGGEGWLVIDVQPENATVTLLGPQGYLGRFTGGGTITGLEPGVYLLTAAQGNFSHRMDAEIRQRETTRVDLVIDELARSEDAGQGPATAQEGEANESEAAEGEAADDADGQDGAPAEEETEEADQADDPSSDDGDEADGQANGDDGDEAWFTEEQADRGAEAYAANCASCHGEDGMGEPPLADGAIAQSFDTVWALFEYTSSQMPQDAPGSLDEDEYVDITAHMLHLNDFPAGEEELEADEGTMSDMQLGDAEGGDGETADTEQADDEASDAGAEQNEQGATAAERGASLYASSCAMCHGPTLAGITAPPLAGPVFMERWGGHPVEWLYFQARMSMPPEAPRSLAEEAYVDLIVYILAENAVLVGDEDFDVGDPRLEQLIIGTAEQQDATLQQRIDQLRQELHRPFDEEDDPEAGADEVGVPGAEVPAEDEDANNEDGEDEEGGEDEGGEAPDPEDAEAPAEDGPEAGDDEEEAE